MFLRDVTGRALLQRLDGNVFASRGGHQNRGDQRILFLHGSHEFQAVHLRHLQIGQDEIRNVQPDLLECILAIGCIDHRNVSDFSQ